MDFQWTKKDLLSLYDLSRDEILHILNTAEEFKKVSQRNVKKVPALRGRTVVNLFVEPSTRTRVSFELAEQRLSAPRCLHQDPRCPIWSTWSCVTRTAWNESGPRP